MIGCWLAEPACWLVGEHGCWLANIGCWQQSHVCEVATYCSNWQIMPCWQASVATRCGQIVTVISAMFDTACGSQGMGCGSQPMSVRQFFQSYTKGSDQNSLKKTRLFHLCHQTLVSEYPFSCAENLESCFLSCSIIVLVGECSP